MATHAMHALRPLVCSALAPVLVFVLGACAPKAAVAPPITPAVAPLAVAPAFPHAGKLQLLVTVDWEGGDLREENLLAMENFRARYPGVRLLHFLNAAYYTRSAASPELVTASIRRVVRPGDEYGLHVHGWKGLFQAAGVRFRGEPRWGGLPAVSADGPECAYDCGIDIPISAYTTEELRKVVRFSIDTLASKGFGRARSFRAGGWMMRPSVRDAIVAEGITSDHSAVPTTFLAFKIRTAVIWEWLNELWPDTTDVSQPYMLPTATSALLEVPDNGALAGYTTGPQMMEVYRHNRDAFLRDPEQNVVLSFGFHQELAKRDLPDLMDGLAQIYAAVKAENLPLENVTSEAISARRAGP